jgi:DNA polymerase-3 subunit alpha
MAAKAVVRDVGRVLGHPYGMVDKLAKLIPFELGITLDKALAQEEELKRRYEQEDEVRILIDLALKLEGLARNAGKHAGGVVIAPSRLTDFTALYCEPGGDNRVTQFDKDDIEVVGLVKFDFLGLRTLTIIDWTVQTINRKRQQNNEPLLDIARIPIDDEKTYKLLKACLTTAVFQLESRGMKDLVKRLQPGCFEDIIDLGALFRPGPLQSGMVDDYINRKHGRAKVEYPHPLLEPILRSTYGMIVYQEQVMQIAQVLAGYTLGGADLLRRAMGKKKPEEMAKQREIFLEGSKKNNIDSNTANFIFDLMEKFSGYGFNKSHSAAYALVTYQTAWLKAHYPAEFMAAVLSSDMDNTEKVVFFLDECRNLNLTVIPPNINNSQYKFTVNEQGNIVYGLGAIKGVGEAAIESIIESRQQEGRFKDIFDFCRRVDTRKLNRRALEALIRAGSMDELYANRASLIMALEPALQAAEQHLEKISLGQHDLFGEASNDYVQPDMPKVPDCPMQDRLQGEKEVLGFYLSGHPLQRYEHELLNFISAPLGQLNAFRNQTVIVAGWVIGLRTLFTKRGDRMAIVTLEDRTSRLDLTVFSEPLNAYRELLNKDTLLIVEGEISIDEFTGNNKILARRLFDITTAREAFAEHLLIKVDEKLVKPIFFEQLQQIIKPFCAGRFPVYMQYHRADSIVNLLLGDKWLVKPTDQLLNNLQEVLGDDGAYIYYAGKD